MQETEFALESGEWTAVVAPLGASLRGASYRGKPVVTGYMGRENKVGGQGDVLIPFPGRVGGGTYVWDGVRYAMERNDKDGPNAIHGFLRSAQWQAADVQSDQATFAIVLEGAKGYPFALLAAVSYQLSESGLTCELAVTNAGDVDAPVAAGFHPYFTTGSESIDDDELELPFESVLEFENLIPTGKILPCTEADLDFYSPRKIGSTRFNHCFLNPEPDCDGLTTVKLRNKDRTVSVWMGDAFKYVVVYSGDPLPESHRRTSLAIEPMTCGSDAFNNPEWGLTRLAPGDTRTGRWGVRASG